MEGYVWVLGDIRKRNWKSKDSLKLFWIDFSLGFWDEG